MTERDAMTLALATVYRNACQECQVADSDTWFTATAVQKSAICDARDRAEIRMMDAEKRLLAHLRG